MKPFQTLLQWARFAVILPLLLGSCDLPPSENSVYEEIDLVRLEIDTDHILAPKAWVIVYFNQKQLAMSTIQSGGTTILRSEAPANAILTVVMVGITESVPKHYTVETFTDIPAGYTFYFTGPYPALIQPSRSGEFTGRVTGIPGSADEFVMTDEYTARAYPQTSGSEINFLGAPAVDKSEYNLVVRATNGPLRHKILPGVGSADDIEVQWSEMVAYDQEITFTFPKSNAVYLNVVGTGLMHDFDKVFQLNLHEQTDSHTSITAGYINFMHKYETQLVVGYPDHALVYKKLGDVPESVTWPDPATYTVINPSLANYQSKVTGPFTYRVSTATTYGPGLAIDWRVMSRGVALEHPPLPKEILADYPELALDKQEATETLFIAGPETFLEGVARYIAVDPTHEAVGVLRY